ncbi:uncharacterized protein LOC126908853 [Daktulosphaira vitifoliae]|uniref:uncharacterized protein LOC126908853 n=1 Tax=Daktulosphaira vitifoliae TaxID=58002 RepID=UPI0021AA351A|nr:uncharacterized protein LOC126908853 [Daktulosphaira vitifoliae]
MAPRKKSDMWNHFTELENSRAKCGYYSKILSIAGGSFGNLSRLIKTVHSAVLISKVTVNSNENFVDDPTNHGSSYETLNVPGIIVSNASQPTSSTNINRTQSSTMHFMQNKKPMTVSRSKQNDEQVTEMIVKG